MSMYNVCSAMLEKTRGTTRLCDLPDHIELATQHYWGIGRNFYSSKCGEWFRSFDSSDSSMIVTFVDGKASQSLCKVCDLANSFEMKHLKLSTTPHTQRSVSSNVGFLCSRARSGKGLRQFIEDSTLETPDSAMLWSLGCATNGFADMLRTMTKMRMIATFETMDEFRMLADGSVHHGCAFNYRTLADYRMFSDYYNSILNAFDAFTSSVSMAVRECSARVRSVASSMCARRRGQLFREMLRPLEPSDGIVGGYWNVCEHCGRMRRIGTLCCIY